MQTPPSSRGAAKWKAWAARLAFIFIILLATYFAVLPLLIDWGANRRLDSALQPTSDNAEQLHQNLLIADLHNDALLWNRNLAKRNNRGLSDLPRLAEGNMALQAFSVVTKVPFGLNIERNDDNSDMVFWLGLAQAWSPKALNSLLQRALRAANRLEALAEESDGLTLIRNQSDLKNFISRRRHQRDLIGGWLTLEGAQSLEGNLANLDKLYDAGYRMIAPTHFFDTEISGSAHGVKKGGLTSLGQEWLSAMEERQLIVDLAHASAQAMVDILERATRPVIVSHTGVKGTCDNNRNLSDAQVRMIADHGGLIGIGFWPTAVCGRDVNAIAKAITYTGKLVGFEHVALGSDMDGAIPSPIDATELVHLTEALLREGLTEDQVRAVMGENIVAFLTANLPPG